MKLFNLKKERNSFFFFRERMRKRACTRECKQGEGQKERESENLKQVLCPVGSVLGGSISQP